MASKSEDVRSTARLGRVGREQRRRKVLTWLAVIAIALVTLPLAAVWLVMVRMPGTSAASALPAMTPEDARAAERMRVTVTALAAQGEHNLAHPKALLAAASQVERELVAAGYTPKRETFEVDQAACDNFVVVVPGSTRASEVVLVGAHYDSAEGAPGANDNGSGVAVMLELARRFAGKPLARTLRFVAFTNEEPPYFRKATKMGSRVHQANARARGDRIVGMLSLETMGWFSEEKGSQKYPFPFSLFYPDRGNFIGFVSNIDSGDFVRRVIGRFRERATVPSQGGALPAKLPGVGWSDHESFYLDGIPALMVTDTAPFRYPHYHTPQDTADKVDYERLARVVVGLAHVVDMLGNDP